MTNSAPADIGVFIPSYVGGGAERMGVFVAAALADAGYRADLVVSCPHGELRAGLHDDPPAGVTVMDLKAPTEFLTLPAYLAYLKRRKPKAVMSLVHTANLTSGLGRAFNREVKTVVAIHNSLIRAPRDQWWFRRVFGHGPESGLYRRCERVMAVCDGLARETETAFGLEAGSVRRIYNPMLNSPDEKNEIAPEHEAIFAKPVVLGVGRLARQKNFSLLIDAFAQSAGAHDANLLILGEGPERASLTARIAECGLQDRIFMPGWTAHPGAYMRRAHTFVLSSRFEGFGLVCVEAMAAGAGLIAVDCPHGPSEILDGGRFGALIQPGDVQGLATAITNDLNRPARAREDVIAERRGWLNQFSPQTAARHYVDMIEDLIGKPER